MRTVSWQCVARVQANAGPQFLQSGVETRLYGLPEDEYPVRYFGNADLHPGLEPGT